VGSNTTPPNWAAAGSVRPAVSTAESKMRFMVVSLWLLVR
jgi:hypothetical protein